MLDDLFVNETVSMIYRITRKILRGPLPLVCLFLAGLTSLTVSAERALQQTSETPDAGWIDLMASDLSAWKEPHGDWQHVGGVEVDPKNIKKLLSREGKGVWYNGPKGRTQNLFSKKKFADVELHVEFNIR